MKKLLLVLLFIFSYAQQQMDMSKIDCNSGKNCFNKSIQALNQNDIETSFKYVLKGCIKFNDAKSCSRLGEIFENLNKFKEAIFFYTKACELNDGKGCNNLGFLYDNGQGVRQNYFKAKQYYGKACDLGFQRGCKNYAILNQQGY